MTILDATDHNVSLQDDGRVTVSRDGVVVDIGPATESGITIEVYAYDPDDYVTRYDWEHGKMGPLIPGQVSTFVARRRPDERTEK